MRALRFFFVLAFGLAMVGPEAHHCPVHDQHAPAPASHHQQGGDHQQASHKLCTCPQACCPVTTAVAIVPQSWTLTAPLARLSAQSPAVRVIVAARKHLQPLAQAPPAPITRG